MKGFYGDQSRFFLGIVVNNDDTELHLGRVQIRIFGVHDNWEDIPDWSLPWAQVVLPTTEGGINGLGANPMIETGSQVFGFFLDGKDSQLPLVLGTIPKIMTPTAFQQSSFTNCSAAIPIPAVNNRADTAIAVAAIPQSALVGSSNAEKAFNFMLMNGFNAKQSAAIVGNMAMQSGTELSTQTDGITIMSRYDRGYGIVGWRGNRFTALVEYSQKINQPTIELSTQLSWVIEELKTDFAPAAAKIKSARDIDIATNAVQFHYFENKQLGGIEINHIIDIAEDVYERFA